MFKTKSKENTLGALTWTAVVDPSGTISKLYRWTKNGNLVYFWFKINASVAGSLVYSLEFDLPSDLPTPSMWTTQANNSLIAIGHSFFSPDNNPDIAITDGLKLFKDGTGNYKLLCQTSIATNSKNVWGYINYMI